MAVHDPDSSLQEKQLALRLGRQKKVQFIDGQQVEVLTGDEEEMNGSTAELLNVNGNDGQQYVVLEVIQLHDSEGGEQALAVVTGDGNNTVTLTKEDLLADDGQLTTEEEDLMEALREKKNIIKLEKKENERDMDDCFGFVDEEEMEDEEEEMEDEDEMEDEEVITGNTN
jgi:molybdopterin converting factor small subunit